MNKYEKRGMRLATEKEREILAGPSNIFLMKAPKKILFLLTITLVLFGVVNGFIMESIYAGVVSFLGVTAFAFVVVGGTLFTEHRIRKKAKEGNLYVYDGVYKLESKKEELYIRKKGCLSKVYRGSYGAPRWQVKEEITKTSSIIAVPVSDTYWIYKKR